MSFAKTFRQVYDAPPSRELTNMIEPNPEGSTTSMTATTDPPKLKPSAKPAAVSTEQAADGGAAAKKDRSYRITKELTLDLTDPMSLVQQLQSVATGDEGNPEPVVVYVRVGTGKGINPDAALKSFGSDNDMAGDYEAVAESSIKAFKGVSTETKRQVSFS